MTKDKHGKNRIEIIDDEVSHLYVGNSVHLIDTEEVERIRPHSWCLSKSGAGVFRPASRIKGKVTLLYRLIMNAEPGDLIDHINQDVHDHRKANLRIVTKSENAMNQKLSAANKTGYRGVYFSEKRQRYVTQIGLNRKSYYVGQYKDVKVAARAYDTAKRKFHPSAPEHAYNFPRTS